MPSCTRVALLLAQVEGLAAGVAAVDEAVAVVVDAVAARLGRLLDAHAGQRAQPGSRQSSQPVASLSAPVRAGRGRELRRRRRRGAAGIIPQSTMPSPSLSAVIAATLEAVLLQLALVEIGEERAAEQSEAARATSAAQRWLIVRPGAPAERGSRPLRRGALPWPGRSRARRRPSRQPVAKKTSASSALDRPSSSVLRSGSVLYSRSLAQGEDAGRPSPVIRRRPRLRVDP